MLHEMADRETAEQSAICRTFSLCDWQKSVQLMRFLAATRPRNGRCVSSVFSRRPPLRRGARFPRDHTSCGVRVFDRAQPCRPSHRPSDDFQLDMATCRPCSFAAQVVVGQGFAISQASRAMPLPQRQSHKP